MYLSFSSHYQGSIDFNIVNIRRTVEMYFLVFTGNMRSEIIISNTLSAPWGVYFLIHLTLFNHVAANVVNELFLVACKRGEEAKLNAAIVLAD